MDRFAAGSTVFDWAMATTGWTLPSHATMFTGRYPQRTGVDFEHRLGRRDPTVAEAFAAHGYATAGFVANLDYVSWESGLDRGFAFWSDYPRSWEMVLKSTLHGQTRLTEQLLRANGWRERLRALRRKQLIVEPKPEGPPVLAGEITDRFLFWHQERSSKGPWFAFLNYFDPHKPYLAPRDRVAHASRSDTLRAGYEGEIAYLDLHAGRLLDSLERRGAMRNTVVVITADHGEHFGEHDLQGHANSVYTTLVHVPLILRWDGHVPAGHRVTRVVSLRDLAQTLVELAGLRRARFPGYSLTHTWQDSLAPVSDVVAQHERAGDRDLARPASEAAMTSIFDDNWQLIRTMRRAIEEMYDYRRDRDAERNLVGTAAATRARDSLVTRLRNALRADNADSLARIGLGSQRR
jgi:arylsulfatase A-like enzyme